MSSLPIGWENRSNCMSEKDMKLGGIAATKFIDKRLANSHNTAGNNIDGGGDSDGANAYSGDAVGVYQTSDQVRAHYNRQIEHQQQQQQIQQQKQIQIQNQNQQAHNDDNNDSSPFASSSNRHGGHQAQAQSSSSTPQFWEERQQMRELEAEGFRNRPTDTTKSGIAIVPNASPKASRTTGASTSTSAGASAHVALVNIATHTLECLADAFEQHDSAVDIPLDDRAALAKAIQRAMQALAKAKK